MSVEMLTYAALGAHLKISPEAARALAKRLRLPRSLSRDGKALVNVDLAEIRHTPRAPSVSRQRSRLCRRRSRGSRLRQLATAQTWSTSANVPTA